jgi:hypothetical protein
MTHRNQRSLAWPNAAMTSTPPLTSSARSRYGFLWLLLLFLAWNLFDLPKVLGSQKSGRFGNLFIALTLLFNHVSLFCIRPSIFRRVATGVSLAWGFFTCAYVVTHGFTRPNSP